MPRLYRSLPLTPRGWVLTGVVVAGVVLGLLFGSRSLNAVVAPAVVALAVAVWQVSSVDIPPLRRSNPSVGSRGERHEVRLRFDGEIERFGRITDTIPTGLEAKGNDRVVPLESGLRYELFLAERGRYQLGPASVAVRDLLGLAQRSRDSEGTNEVVVYPRIHPVATPNLRRLAEAANIRLERERHEFDRLREYQPTDSLRDIHWKTSAKRPDADFIVKEFVTERDRGSVMLSGEAAEGADDALAEALASLASALVDHGVRVGILTGNGKVEPIKRSGQFNRILTHLATLGPGRPAVSAEVHLTAESPEVDAVTIKVDDTAFEFGALRGPTHGRSQRPDQPAPAHPTGEVAD